MTDLSVEGFHRKGNYAVLTDGQVLQITAWFDGYGDEVGAFDSPKTACAGPDSNGKWWSIDIAEFEPMMTQ